MSLNKFYNFLGTDLDFEIGCKEIRTSTASISTYNFITSLDDFPGPVDKVITLQAFSTYFIVGNIDLLGNRLVGSERVVLLGSSSENSSITSTGLGVGVALFTTNWATSVRYLTFKDIDTCLDIDGDPSPDLNDAFDWRGVNFTDIPNIGVVKDIDNFIFAEGAFLNSKNLLFTGIVGTIAFSNCILVGDGSVGAIIRIGPGSVISRRLRIIYSSFVVFGSTVGIDVDVSASVPDEAYILDFVNFSGAGSYITGIDFLDNRALFIRNTGIQNSFVNGQIYMTANVVATPITNTTDYQKILGTTIPSDDNAKYIATDNRLTNDAVIERKFLVHADLSFISTSNNVCFFGFYDSRLGTVREPSKTSSTANASGRAENISLSCVVNHNIGDYLEVWCRNSTAVNPITVTDLNFIITQL